MSNTSLLELANCIKSNKTLIKLSLSWNKISDTVGMEICKALKSNITLTEIYLDNNYLGEQFGIQLANVLQTNYVLYIVDISNNPISNASGQQILSSLTNYNESLKSLGNLSTNYSINIRTREEIRQVLIANSLPKELKVNLESVQYNELLESASNAKSSVHN